MTPPPDPSSFLDQGSGDFLRKLDAMKNSVYAGIVSGANTQAWDGDQLALQQQINVLADQLGVDIEPQIIGGEDDFAHLSLEQIRDLVSQIQPGVVQAVSDAWSQIGSGMADGSETARHAVVQQAITDGWQGDAGKKATDSLNRLFDTVRDIGRSSSMVAMKVAFAQRGSDETFRMLTPLLQQMVPEGPPPVDPMGGAGPHLTSGPATPRPVLPQIGAVQSTQAQRDDATDAARQVLRNVYAPGIRGGDQGVPVLPTVQPVANSNGPIAPVTPGPTPGPSTPNLGGGDQPQTPGDANPNADPNSGNDGNQSPETQPTSNTSGAGQNPSSTPGSGLPNAASTSAAGFDPNSLGGGHSGSGLGGGSHGSGAGGGLSGPGSAKPGLGSAVPGGMAAAAQGVPAGMRPPGQTGTPGMPGMSPGAGGKGGKSEEDKERQSADYLRGDHLEEWIDDGRKVLPAYGAIGENPSQEQQPDRRPPAPRPPNPPDRGRAPGEYR
ncbi:hypothetical protein AB0L57_13275 [Nocardia sp. NPDC052254]|uniref:hypothetical protein n=1 Tax=Nocardia sp. NPDC052254 TaxID=3155681 RepID=UPI0034132F64